jgi:hypothetical protein
MSMSDEPQIPEALNASFKKGDIPIKSGKPGEEQQPVYQMLGDTRIPVSKHLGKLWKSRRDAAISRREAMKVSDAWTEAVKYYKNDQLNHRNQGDPDLAQNQVDEIEDAFSETENIVFANTASLVPTLYSKNPVIEATAPTDDMKPLALRLERLINKLFERKSEPGVNLKPKIRRAISLGVLTNNAWLETGWTFREASSQAAFEELNKLSLELQNAKSTKEIQEVEGKLMALEAKMDYLRPAGPYVRVRTPFDILIDPAAVENTADAQWLIDFDFIPTDFLRAMYSSKDAETGEWKSIFQPTHVMKLKGSTDNQGLDEEIAQFSLIRETGDGMTYKTYGFDDNESFRKAQYTRVARVWDKVTRRVMLFNNNDWSWPLWVWDDPYQFPDFFPFDLLQFYTDPVGDETKGEVSYYLDQQDAINEINTEKKLARQWARKNIVYDRNRVNADDASMIVRGGKQGAFGIDVPEGGKIDDILKAILPPSANFMQLFDKQPQLDAIDRLSSVRSVQRGAEFKTNTTNEAIKRYDATSETRLDEKVDAIEDLIGSIGNRIAFLCLVHMDEEAVNDLIGPSETGAWQNLPAKEAAKLSITVVGGSMQKPSSGAKKEEAMQVGQVLGQFVKASPVALVVALKMFEEAFDSITIKDEDWALIRQSVESQLQQGQGGPGDGTGGDIMAMYDKLPPEAKKAFGDATSKGAPAEQVMQAILEKVKGAEAEAQQQQMNPIPQGDEENAPPQ